MTNIFKLLHREANKEYAAAMRRVNLNVNDYGLACFKAGVLHERNDQSMQQYPDDSDMMELVP